MRQMEVTEKKIGDDTFYLRPFPAFTAANVSGDLAAVLTPLLGAAASVSGKKEGDGGEEADDSDAAAALGSALSGLSGDQVEKVLRKLLTDHKNISVEAEATDWNVKPLTADLANEIFCSRLEDMLELCIEVVRLNYGGFFGKLGIRFGSLTGPDAPTSESGESSTHPGSASWSSGCTSS